MKTQLDEGNAREGPSGCLGGIRPQPPPPKCGFLCHSREGSGMGTGGAGFGVQSAAGGPLPSLTCWVSAGSASGCVLRSLTLGFGARARTAKGSARQKSSDQPSRIVYLKEIPWFCVMFVLSPPS